MLARAIALDAQRRDAVSLVDLRAAAVEAGIDLIAFDRAVAELGPDARVPTSPPRAMPSRWAPVVANLKAAFAFWVTLTILTRVGHLLPPDWTVSAVRNIVAVGIGLGFAFRFRATVAQVVLGGMAAALVSLFVIRLIFGMGAAQGGPTHFAVLLAGLLGVVATAVSGRLTRQGQGTPPAHRSAANAPAVGGAQVPPPNDARESPPVRLVSIGAT